MRKIVMGSDHRGFVLKNRLKHYLESKGYKVVDLGTFSRQSCDYPEVAYMVAKLVSTGEFKRGILICYSGIGNCITANKIPGIRAAVCYNIKLTRLSREHNNTNILVLGAGFVSQRLAARIADTWLNTKFSSGRHLRRLRKIERIQKKR